MPENNQNTELRSEQVQELLTAVPNWMIRYGNTLIVCLVLMLLCISWLVKYPDVINAQAIITTKVPPQKEYAKLTGKLDTVFVTNAEKVKVNSVLAIVENTSNYNDVYKLKSIVDTIKPNTESFYFPINALPILFLGEIDNDFAIFENSYLDYILNKELQPFSNDALANKNSLSESRVRLKNAKAQLEINRRELEFKKKIFDRNKELLRKGVIAQLEFDNNQIEYAQATRNFKNFEASISQIRESISNANKSSIGTIISQKREEVKLLKNVLQSFGQLKNAIKDWEQKYVLKSNIDGDVSFLNFQDKNHTVQAGEVVFTIIPSQNSSYIAKLKTPILNSGKLKVGQQVNISIDNYPETEFGYLMGNINEISAIPDSEGYYMLDVKLFNKLTTSYNKEISFKPEMQGSAQIITDDLRLLERFFYQFKQVIGN